MALPGSWAIHSGTPLPRLGRYRRPKNPLVPSKEQAPAAGSGVAAPSLFGASYSTEGTAPLDQAEDDYRQVLGKLRQAQKDCLIVGRRAVDVASGATKVEDVEVVSGTSEASSYDSDD
ncbi:hypothetical protein IWQ57_002261 [Coemansia nantahalensis]|uniref:Uncharacterized protein n=1 Tax=Coemansia nantahalensis TaxID=2789366 RepID=A0ACC1K187_9FUNG|nr:hypothetical protein IWQ57_002261 [Coemansia nantahalensis]